MFNGLWNHEIEIHRGEDSRRDQRTLRELRTAAFSQGGRFRQDKNRPRPHLQGIAMFSRPREQY